MAKVTLSTVACDVCSRSELVNGIKVEPVEIRLGETRVKGDLCEDDSGPVREAIKALPGAKKRRRSFEDSVVESPDDIPKG